MNTHNPLKEKECVSIDVSFFNAGLKILKK